MLKPGGKITVDVYPWLVRNLAWSKYWLRLITRRLPTNTLFRVVERATPAHDDPQRQTTLAAWFAEAGLEECVTERVGFFVGRGTKPRAAVGVPEEAGRRARSFR